MKSTLLTFALVLSASALAQQRKEITLDTDWQFSRDKQEWQTVSVPHDWAISGPFDKKWDLQVVAIEQNGEKEATEKSGRSGSLPWIGKGYYQRTLQIPEGYGHAELVFDGAMAEPTVYINGQRAGYWAYGYNTFRVDITPFVKPGNNKLAVDLQNVEESSRWYPGAGIYRPVKLVLTDKSWIDPWGTFFRTTALNDQEGTVEVTTTVKGPVGADTGIEVELRDQQGRIVAQEHVTKISASGEADAVLCVRNPQAWSPESPYLYKATVRFMQNGRTIDEISQRVGLRTVKVSAEGGFQLNGKTRKLKGVCLHHDLGPLGAAVNKAAIIRQIRTMKDMGCDAIRTSHNMPSQMQMDVCDSLGMMVMAESFDMWIYPKCKNGYSRFFKEWSSRDIENLVRANRNHPAVVMWSIGNEIPEQNDAKAVEIINRLQGLCHQLDPTRPVTQGMDRIDNALSTGFAQAMDIPGMNYRLPKYQMAYDRLGKGFLLGSETASTVSSRGVYKFPVKPDDNSRYSSWAQGYDPTAIKNADGQCSGYDVEYCAWSNLPDDDWRWQDDKQWVIGEFVWTGYDYLGEPSPYDEYWPSRSSYFGICDLAGLPKDRYFLYRSHWNKNQHTLHLLPHWSWGVLSAKGAKRGTTAKNRIGQVTPVYCYTDYNEGELFVNGKSQGRIKKVVEQPGVWKPENRLDRYRLRWNDVKYEPGELRVVVYDDNGKVAGEQTIKTAGKPAALRLQGWSQSSENSPIASLSPMEPISLCSDGLDLAFVTVSLQDKDGNFIPDATDQLRFEVEGAGTFRAACNGDATSLEPFTEPTMKLFAGQLVVVVQAAKQKGTLRLRVIDDERNLSETINIAVK
jgi:beta-galactosidase